jgi:hypothetical protein
MSNTWAAKHQNAMLEKQEVDTLKISRQKLDEIAKRSFEVVIYHKASSFVFTLIIHTNNSTESETTRNFTTLCFNIPANAIFRLSGSHAGHRHH